MNSKKISLLKALIAQNKKLDQLNSELEEVLDILEKEQNDKKKRINP